MMVLSKIGTALIVMFCAIASGRLVQAAATSGAQQQTTAFRTETDLVVLHVTVRSRSGELVKDLSARDFTIYEEGKAQPIALFRRDDIPVSLGLLIDNSGSMRAVRAKVETAALACARASNPLDEMFVVNFADKVHVDVPLTNDLGVVEAGIRRLDSIGGTALRDAIETGSAYLSANAHHDRKVLLVITDGNDNASMTSIAQIRRQAEQLEVTVYAIGLSTPLRAAARGDLDDLAELTGGAALYPDSLEQLEGAALEIARDIRSQYTLAYSPSDRKLDGTYRKLKVKVKRSDTLVVRARRGYRATRETR